MPATLTAADDYGRHARTRRCLARMLAECRSALARVEGLAIEECAATAKTHDMMMMATMTVFQQHRAASTDGWRRKISRHDERYCRCAIHNDSAAFAQDDGSRV